MNRKNHMIDFLFPVALLFVFAVSAIAVLLFATNIYENSVESSGRNNTARTSIAYVTEKVHQSDNGGRIKIGEIDGCDALIITQKISGKKYKTYIYAADGELRELFTASKFKASKDMGTGILKVSDFKLEKLKKGLIRITCTDGSGKTASAIVGVRSGK